MAAIPNQKGQETNPYDTGWITPIIDLSQDVTFDFSDILLYVDDADSQNGTYRLYVDYIRLEEPNP